MDLSFEKVGNEWVSEVMVESDFNLHLERVGVSSLVVEQRGCETGEYAFSFMRGMNEGKKVFDYDFGALVYPKWIKITSGSEVVKGVLTESK